MSLTPNFGFNIPDAGDIVNLLTQCYPNFILIDTAMQSIKETGVTTATETKSGTTHQIVRTVSDCNVLRFTATSNFVTGDTFTVDGVPVVGVAVNGTSLQTGDFVINSDVMAILNGGKLTLFTGGSGANDASDVSYDNTGSGLTATDVQQAIDELKTLIGALDGSDISYDNTGSGLTASNLQEAIDELKTLIPSTPTYITTGLTSVRGAIVDGGYYIDSNNIVHVDITITVASVASAGSEMITGFPEADAFNATSPYNVNAIYNELCISKPSASGVTSLNTAYAQNLVGKTMHYIGSYLMKV